MLGTLQQLIHLFSAAAKIIHRKGKTMENEAEKLSQELATHNRERKLQESFEHLRPSPTRNLFWLLFIAILGFGVEHYFGEMNVTLPLLVIIVFTAIKGESELLHRRIDVLHKVLAEKPSA